VTAAVAPVKRGTSNGNARGSAADRAARREWLVTTYRANVDVLYGSFEAAAEVIACAPLSDGNGKLDGDGWRIACRCYRCGCLLTIDTVTVDRIVPGCKGGTYRRTNIRPACGGCNSETGGQLAHLPKPRRRRGKK
jgi:hypothetical protein